MGNVHYNNHPDFNAYHAFLRGFDGQSGVTMITQQVGANARGYLLFDFAKTAANGMINADGTQTIDAPAPDLAKQFQTIMGDAAPAITEEQERHYSTYARHHKAAQLLLGLRHAGADYMATITSLKTPPGTAYDDGPHGGEPAPAQDHEKRSGAFR